MNKNKGRWRESIPRTSLFCAPFGDVGEIKSLLVQIIDIEHRLLDPFALLFLPIVPCDLDVLIEHEQGTDVTDTHDRHEHVTDIPNEIDRYDAREEHDTCDHYAQPLDQLMIILDESQVGLGHGVVCDETAECEYEHEQCKHPKDPIPAECV